MGSGEIKELKQENKQLYEEVATRDESIEKLQALIKEQQKQYRKELTEVQARSIKEQNGQKARTDIMQKWINRACKWFPLFDDAFRVEKLCRSVGFTSEQIDRLFTFKPLEYSGNIYSEEHERGISVTKAIAQIKIAQDGKKQRFILCINGKNVFEWFKEQFEKLRQIIHPNLQPLIKNKRLKL